jgi:MFS family permease
MRPAGVAPMRFVRGLPRTVIVLGLVSLLNDAASEMIAPLLPVLLTASLGAGPAIVGLVEGVAEATSSVLKLLSGRWADRGVRPRTLIASGYGLANLVRPLIGVASSWPGVLVLRFLDRTGKGIRTAPRDALVAGAVDASMRGRAFGVHRAMDHAGAVLGPLAASALLAAGLSTRQVFVASVVPGLALMLLIFTSVPGSRVSVRSSSAAPLRWRALDGGVRALLIAASVLAFARVPDAFLVLWAHAAGVSDVSLPLLWAIAHVLRAIAAGMGGGLSDRIGRAPLLLAGWSARVLLLVIVGVLASPSSLVWALFPVYCATTALTEPAEAALVGDRAPVHARGTTLGLYHMLSGVMALPGALIFGIVWESSARASAFFFAAVVTAFAAVLFAVAGRKASAARPPSGRSPEATARTPEA